MVINRAHTNSVMQLVGVVGGLLHVPSLALVLLRISHSIEALNSNLIGTVDQDHTKPHFNLAQS